MNPKHALTILVRLAQRRPEEVGKLKSALAGRLDRLIESSVEVAIESGDPMSLILLDLVKTSSTVDLIEKLGRIIPSRTISLRSLAEEVAKQHLDTQLKKYSKNRLQGELGAAVANWAQRVRALGRGDEGISAAEEGVEIFRRLTESDPEKYREYLTSTLSGLAAALHELGRRIEAVQAAVVSAETVGLWRRACME